jgi:hypothetical protein
MDKILWRFNFFGRSLGRVGECWSQQARVDHMCPKFLAGGRREILHGREK